jgi:protein SFI1
MRSALTRWTNRVIEIKLRELEVAQRNELNALAYVALCSLTMSIDSKIHRVAFKKWKSICVRHVEELSLMESYQFVKREGMLS